MGMVFCIAYQYYICFHLHKWATLQAIAGYGCIVPSGMVAPLSDMARFSSSSVVIPLIPVRLAPLRSAPLRLAPLRLACSHFTVRRSAAIKLTTLLLDVVDMSPASRKKVKT